MCASVVERLPLPVLVLAPDGTLVSANAAARDLLDPDHLLGVDHPDLGCLRNGALPQARATGSWLGSVRLTGRGDGADARITVFALDDDPGAGFGVVICPESLGGPADDRARLLAEVIGQSTEFVAWHGPIGAEARINRAGATLVGGGVTPDQPLPARVRDLFIEEDAEFVNRVGAAEMERTGSWRAPLRIRNRDTGEIRELAFSMFLVRGPDGRVLGSAGMGRDITEQARATAELERAHAELAAAHRQLSDLYEHTRALHEQRDQILLKANEELTAAGAAAQAASTAKSEFVSRMSHELRTPLNAVLGFAQLLEMDLDGDQREKAGQIRRAGRHLLKLINEVLDISCIESGQLALSPEPVRVRDLVADVVELITPLANAHGVGIGIETSGADCACFVQADRRRAMQVLLNLLSNGVKYNNPGGVVRIRCSFPPDGASVRIEVADTGIGIPAEHLHRLFVPFERLAAANSKIEGTGVGLALSQRLATAMGGAIEVRSEPGRGSSFTFVLPQVPDPCEAADGGPGAVCAPPDETPPEAQHRVLSVEDNVANSNLLEHIVGRRPAWTIVHAALGQLGLDLAMADPPDLILLDLHLPDMAGSEVLQRLKADPATRDVPVAILSADATAGQPERLGALGAAAYLTKPLDVAALLDLLDEIAAAPDESGTAVSY